MIISTSRPAQSLLRNNFAEDAHSCLPLVSRCQLVELLQCASPFMAFEVLVNTPSSHLSVIMVGTESISECSYEATF
jgi:hypothetical protein